MYSWHKGASIYKIKSAVMSNERLTILIADSLNLGLHTSISKVAKHTSSAYTSQL